VHLESAKRKLQKKEDKEDNRGEEKEVWDNSIKGGYIIEQARIFKDFNKELVRDVEDIK
jgi:hypothetical protein